MKNDNCDQYPLHLGRLIAKYLSMRTRQMESIVTFTAPRALLEEIDRITDDPRRRAPGQRRQSRSATIRRLLTAGLQAEARS